MTSLCARDASKSGDRSDCSARGDPIWDLVGQYRRICRDKLALQAALLRELDACEREAERDVERARGALAALRRGVGPEHHRRHHDHRGGGGSTCACGEIVPGERPTVTDLDGPRDDPVPVRECGGGGEGERAAQALDTAGLPSCTCMGSPDPAAAAGASPSSCAPACPAAPTPTPDAEPSGLPADGAVFDKYDRMIAALRTRSPPLTLSFLPREEIPWPVLPLPSASVSASDGSDGDAYGTFPVALGAKARAQIDVDRLAAFAAGYARWRDKPLRLTLNILLGHWIAMDKRLKEHGPPPAARSEAAKTRRAIRDVRGKLMMIVAEQGACAVTRC